MKPHQVNAAVILAAGEGKRMRPATTHTPKPMMDLNGKPLLGHMIDALPPQIERVILVTGHLEDVIKYHFDDRYKDREIVYVHQPEPLGTADALRRCAGVLPKYADMLPEWFIFAFADDLQDYRAIDELCQQQTAAMLAHATNNPTAFGILETDSEDFLLRMYEKPEAALIPAIGNKASTGVHLLPKDILQYQPSVVGAKWELHHSGLLEAYVQDGGRVKVVMAKEWLTITDLHDLAQAKVVEPHFPKRSA